MRSYLEQFAVLMIDVIEKVLVIVVDLVVTFRTLVENRSSLRVN